MFNCSIYLFHYILLYVFFIIIKLKIYLYKRKIAIKIYDEHNTLVSLLLFSYFAVEYRRGKIRAIRKRKKGNDKGKGTNIQAVMCR